MKLSRMLNVLLAGLILTTVTARAQGSEPGRCTNDSKLLNDGPTLVYGEGPGTWWGLVIDGLDAAGFSSEEEKIDYLNHVFNTDFDNLNDLKTFNLDLVSASWDHNQNGWVCAYELRGTRAYFNDPFLNLTFFGISDDKLSKN